MVGLQELKASDDKFPHEALSEVGYHAAVHGQKAWNGVAVLSREPGETLERGLSGQEDLGARLITTRVGGICFTTVYCPNGKTLEHEDFGRKLAWFEALSDHLAVRGDPGAGEILCGDFNVCPAALDSWHGEAGEGAIFHTVEERSRLQALFDRGFEDLFRVLHPEARDYSWWDYRHGAFHKGQGLRIDFLLGSRPIVDRLRSVEIDRDYRKKRDDLTPSDHAPVVADLD
ncbi:MAG: endonuclease/exonuclease/phosphatase family protein [Myxococcales bacterium]|nr:endonuclease/exonuclease/phosphatase family protein [Myxococcales bacterium]